MKIEFLGQGFEEASENSVGRWIEKLLQDKRFDHFFGISAFASQAGIVGFSENQKRANEHLKSSILIVGVDQKGTSKEALEEILNAKIESYIFYQPSFPIFHPKIYLFEGAEDTELIIGSSNLTSQGLWTNVEASTKFSLSNRDENDMAFLQQVKSYFKGLFDKTDPNLQLLTPDLITKLVKAKIVPTEEERKQAQDKTEYPSHKGRKEDVINLFPKRAISRIPKEFRGRKKISKTVKTTESGVVDLEWIFDDVFHDQTLERRKLLWISGALTERDLNIPKGTNTNPTGSMLFKKGQTKGIDQRHYFRDTVFSELNWTQDKNPNKTHIERSFATFQISVDGVDRGSYKMKLSHNTDTKSRSYAQKNSMTSISWGTAKKVIAQQALIGKAAYLYTTSKSDHFIIEIK